MRTALTAALFSQPDVLLLDEPTNHLSIDAVLWLSRELASGDVWASRIVVVVSHDRCLLGWCPGSPSHCVGCPHHSD